MISVSYCPWVFFVSLYLMKRLLWAFFLLSMDNCFAGAHSEIWTMSLLWAASDLFSVSHIFSDSQNMLLFRYLPNKIMIDRQELLHCCCLPAPSFSFIDDSEKALFFFLLQTTFSPSFLLSSQLQHFSFMLSYSWIINLSWLTGSYHISFISVLWGWWMNNCLFFLKWLPANLLFKNSITFCWPSFLKSYLQSSGFQQGHNFYGLKCTTTPSQFIYWPLTPEGI